jgi:hypothetical protein
LLSAISLLGCENQNDVEIKTSEFKTQADLNLIKKIFDKIEFQDISITGNLKVMWNKFEITEEEDGFIIYEFQTNGHSRVEIKKDQSKKNQKLLYINYSILAKVNSDESVDFSILKYVGSNLNNLKSINSMELGDFTGNVKIFDNLVISVLNFMLKVH